MTDLVLAATVGQVSTGEAVAFWILAPIAVHSRVMRSDIKVCMSGQRR